MRFSSRLVLIILSSGFTILVLFGGMHYLTSYQRVIEEGQKDALLAASVRASHLTSIFEHRAAAISSLGQSTDIVEAAHNSNINFQAFDEAKRAQQIGQLDTRWKESSGIKDPFVAPYLTNTVAQRLRAHSDRFPGLYGEIFVTNRYGILLGATGRLSTLAHAHKHWWHAAYADGKGMLFFDDRGYDDSVGGYVVGFVAPIYREGELVAIIKANLRLDKVLSDIVSWPLAEHPISLEVIRSGGLVVYAEDTVPLSVKVPAEVATTAISIGVEGASLENIKDGALHALIPILFTEDNALIQLGGIQESFDHSKGNRGETWLIHAEIPIEQRMPVVYESLYNLGLLSIITLILVALVSRYLGREMEKREQELRLHRDHLKEMVAEQTAILRGAKETAEITNETKTQFLANMSHELRTPMHAILGFAETGRQKYDVVPAEKIKHYFSCIEESGKRLLHLLNNLLDLTKLESKHVDYVFNKHDISKLIDVTHQDLQSLITQKSLFFNVEPSTVETTVHCDSNAIIQVFNNLVSNAVKFSQEKGSINISFGTTTLPSAYENKEVPALAVQVFDNGPGIPDSELEYIFDKFVQSSKTRTGAGGTGLGLAICKEIIKAHKGDIWAENSATGGAVFTVALPYKSTASDYVI